RPRLITKVSPSGGHYMWSKFTCPQERAKRAARTSTAAGGKMESLRAPRASDASGAYHNGRGGQDGKTPSGGHHVRSKSTCPKSERSERRVPQRPRGARWQDYVPEERGKGAARASTAGGGKMKRPPRRVGQGGGGRRREWGTA